MATIIRPVRRSCFLYEVSKAATDSILHPRGSRSGLPVAVTRCANRDGGGELNLSRLVPECAVPGDRLGLGAAGAAEEGIEQTGRHPGQLGIDRWRR